jgi:hypothetical protein
MTREKLPCEQNANDRAYGLFEIHLLFCLVSSDCSDLITSGAEDVKQQRLPDQRACS